MSNKSDLLAPLFFKEYQEQFAPSRSFVKSSESNLLSRFFFKEQWEQIAHGRSFERAILS